MGHFERCCRESEKAGQSQRGTNVELLLDTGATVSVIDRRTYQMLRVKPELKALRRKTYAYGQTEPVNMLGEFQTVIRYQGNETVEYVQVIAGEERGVLSKRACVSLGLYFVKALNGKLTKEQVAQKYPRLFSGKIGKMKDVKVKLHINPEVKPKCCKYDRTATFG